MRRLAVVLVAFLGCTTAKPAEEPAPVVVPPLAAPQPSVSGELSLDVPPPPPTLPRHPAGVEEPPTSPPPAIGGACTEPSACGKSGKVAVIYGSGPSVPREIPHPCKTVRTSKTMINSISACVEGDRVFVMSSCIMCRMPSGEQLVGLVADMTPAQLVRAQRLAALPETPLLTTTAAWSGAIALATRNAGSAH